MVLLSNNDTKIMIEWNVLFEKTFSKSKKNIRSRCPINSDGSGNPKSVTIHHILDSFPCGIKVLYVTPETTHPLIEDNCCTLMHYDVTRMKQKDVDFLGTLNLCDESLTRIVDSEFHISDYDNSIENVLCSYLYLSSDGINQIDNCYSFPYDVRKNIKRFQQDFRPHFENIVSQMSVSVNIEPDFNKLWHLKNDRIYTESELTSQDRRLASFRVLINNKTVQPTIQDHQQAIASLQLIPEVPETIKTIIERAKKLYIYAWYQYDFFTISTHYSVLALESAIKARYFSHFQHNVVITNKKEEEHTFGGTVGYEDVLEYCRRNKWDFKSLCINNERFRYSMKSLRDWLVHKKIITKWERDICENRLEIRNHLSHQNFPPTYLGSSARRSLESVIFLINRMFSPCSIPKH